MSCKTHISDGIYCLIFVDVSINTLSLISPKFAGLNYQISLNKSKSVMKLGMSSVVLHLHSSPTS